MTMQRLPVLLLALVSSCVFHVERHPRNPDGDPVPLADSDAEDRGPSPFHVGFLMGYRELDDEDFWDPVEGQFALGAEFAVEPPDAFVGWELGVAASGWTEEEGDADVTGSVSELYGGARKTFGSGTIQPYVGAGLSLFTVETSAEEDFQGGDRILRDEDGGVGVYWRAGLLWPVGERARLGLDYRAMIGPDVDFFRADGDSDFAQLSLVLLTSF